MAVDVDVGVGQGARQAGHPARSIVDLGEDRLALDVDVAALVEDGLAVVSSSAVVMITWPLSPMLPPPIARRSTPRSASASASVAIAPGSFFSWTTNCLAMLPPRCDATNPASPERQS